MYLCHEKGQLPIAKGFWEYDFGTNSFETAVKDPLLTVEP